MSGNMWIVVGVIAGAISAFSLPYGFFLKSRDKTATEVTANEHVSPNVSAKAHEDSKDTVPPPVPIQKDDTASSPDYSTKYNIVKGLSYSVDRDKEFLKLVDVALADGSIEWAKKFTAELSYSVDRDRMYKSIFSKCLNTKRYNDATAIIDYLSYSVDKDKARSELLQAMQPK